MTAGAMSDQVALESNLAATAASGKVAALGRKIAGLWRAHDEADIALLRAELSAEYVRAAERMAQIEGEIEAATAAALAMRAETDGDRATHAALSAEFLNILADEVGEEWRRELCLAIVAERLATAARLAQLCGTPVEELGHCDFANHLAGAFLGAATEGVAGTAVGA